MCKYYHLLFFLTVYCIKNNCDEIEPSSPNLINNKADKPPALLDKLVPDSSQVHPNPNPPSNQQQQSANAYPGPIPPPSAPHEADGGVLRPPSPYFPDQTPQTNSPSPLPPSVASRPSERNEELKTVEDNASDMRQESMNNSNIHDSDVGNKTSTQDVSTNSSSSASHNLESSQNSSSTEDQHLLSNNTMNEMPSVDTSSVNSSISEQMNISVSESKIGDEALGTANKSLPGTNHSDHENSAINSTAPEDKPHASHEIHKRSVESFVTSDTQNSYMEQASVSKNDPSKRLEPESNSPTGTLKINDTMKPEQVNSGNINVSSASTSTENDTKASIISESDRSQGLAGQKSNTTPENASIEANHGETSSSPEVRSEGNEKIRPNNGASYSSPDSENSQSSYPNIGPAQGTVSSNSAQEKETVDAKVSSNNNVSSSDPSQPNISASLDNKSFEESPTFRSDVHQKDETNQIDAETGDSEDENIDAEEEERSSFEEEIVIDELKENMIYEKSEESPIVSTPAPEFDREIPQPTDQQTPLAPNVGNPEPSIGLASLPNDPHARVLQNNPGNLNVAHHSSDSMGRDASKLDSSQNQIANDGDRFSESMSNNLTPDGTVHHNQHADNSASLTQHSSSSDESKYVLPVEPNLTKEMFSDSKSLEYSAIPGLTLLTDLLPEPLRDSLEHVDFPLRVFVLIIVVSIFWLMMFTVHAFFSYKSDRDAGREELCRKDKQVHDIGLERDHLACELDSAIKQIKDLERNSRAREEDLRRREQKMEKTFQESKSLEAQRDKLYAELEELQQYKEKSERDHKELQKDFLEKTNNCILLQTKMNVLQKDLGEHKKNYLEAEKNSSELKSELDRLKSQKEDLESRLTELSSLHEDLNSKYRDVEEVKKTLEADLESLRSCLSSKDDELISLREQVEHALNLVNEQKPLGDRDYAELIDNRSQHALVERMREEKNQLTAKLAEAEIQVKNAEAMAEHAFRERDEAKIGEDKMKTYFHEQQREASREIESLRIEKNELMAKLGADTTFRQENEELRNQLTRMREQWEINENDQLARIRGLERQCNEILVREKELRRSLEYFKFENDRMRQVVMAQAQGPNSNRPVFPPPPPFPMGDTSLQFDTSANTSRPPEWSADILPPPPPPLPPFLSNMMNHPVPSGAYSSLSRQNYSSSHHGSIVGAGSTRETYSPASQRSDQRSFHDDYNFMV
ncbi:uncharacterized protein LOC141850403 [Brevipalpus obovatus]|uniref:uncharacterized protein LOC141850403 n=1 Tax=Brevipalpus obovatus TaxID=246614 RepID=UPI003D9E8194